jgi:lipopolysaccharide transport system ATP-binding protein
VKSETLSDPGSQSKPLITLDNASLEINSITSEYRSLKRSILTLGRKPHSTNVRLLNNINLSIQSGDRIAIIGRNGSGKTTLLRLISGIYKPTSGTIESNCNIFPLIHKSFLVSQELDGLTAAKAFYISIYNCLNGWESYIYDVLEFSGIGDYIYAPLKVYSEGMSSRLLFAMFTALQHECLVMDESFGMGDAEFFAKAQSRLNSFVDKTSILIMASHSEELLRKFCSTGLVISCGQVAYISTLDEALDYYNQMIKRSSDA